jgi:hypothetical protein
MGIFDLFRKRTPILDPQTEGELSSYEDKLGNCPVCNRSFHIRVYDILDASEHPNAYAQLLKGLVNSFSCECGKIAAAVVPLLVHIPAARRVVLFVSPALSIDQQNDAADALMLRFHGFFRDPQDYMGDLEILEMDADGYQVAGTYLRKNAKSSRT